MFIKMIMKFLSVGATDDIIGGVEVQKGAAKNKKSN
jgi:hypothetical protein